MNTESTSSPATAEGAAPAKKKARKPAESAAIQYVRGNREPRMPKGMPPLSDLEIQMLEAWIHAGAPDDSATTAVAPAKTGAQPAPANPLNDALFSDADQLAAIRRKVRLAYVQRPPDPRLESGAADVER